MDAHNRGSSWTRPWPRWKAAWPATTWPTINNAEVVAAALLWGDGDFGRTIGLASEPASTPIARAPPPVRSSGRSTARPACRSIGPILSRTASTVPFSVSRAFVSPSSRTGRCGWARPWPPHKGLYAGPPWSCRWPPSKPPPAGRGNWAAGPSPTRCWPPRPSPRGAFSPRLFAWSARRALADLEPGPARPGPSNPYPRAGWCSMSAPVGGGQPSPGTASGPAGRGGREPSHARRRLPRRLRGRGRRMPRSPAAGPTWPTRPPRQRWSCAATSCTTWPTSPRSWPRCTLTPSAGSWSS